jgi:hypothetical protein
MYARVFGVVLTLVGVLGLLINTDQNTTESLLGFDVNLTHNLVHLITGVLGLVAGFSMLVYARVYALVLGIVYALLGIWGLASGGNLDPFDLFVNINMADHFLHLAIGVLGIGAYVASRDDARIDTV